VERKRRKMYHTRTLTKKNRSMYKKQGVALYIMAAALAVELIRR